LASGANDVILSVTDVDVTRVTVTLCGLPGGPVATGDTHTTQLHFYTVTYKSNKLFPRGAKISMLPPLLSERNGLAFVANNGTN